jgi:hypothetical protein
MTMQVIPNEFLNLYGYLLILDLGVVCQGKSDTSSLVLFF